MKVALRGIEWVDSKDQRGKSPFEEYIVRPSLRVFFWHAEIRTAAGAVGMWAKASISPRSLATSRPRHGTRGKRSRSAKRIVHISTAFFGVPLVNGGLERCAEVNALKFTPRGQRSSARPLRPSNPPTRFPEEPENDARNDAIQDEIVPFERRPDQAGEHRAFHGASRGMALLSVFHAWQPTCEWNATFGSAGVETGRQP